MKRKKKLFCETHFVCNTNDHYRKTKYGLKIIFSLFFETLQSILYGLMCVSVLIYNNISKLCEITIEDKSATVICEFNVEQ